MSANVRRAPHSRPSYRWLIGGGTYLAVLVLAVVLSAVGSVSLWAVMLWAAVPAVVLLQQRLGAAAAVALAGVALVAVAMLVLVFAPFFHAATVPAVLVVSLLGGTLGTLEVMRAGEIRRPSVPGAIVALAPALGAVIWIAVLVIARARPGRHAQTDGET